MRDIVPKCSEVIKHNGLVEVAELGLEQLLCPGVYKVPYSSVYQVCWGRISSCKEGKVISWLSVRIRRGREVKEKQFHPSFNIEAVGKNIKWETGTEI